MKDLLAAIAGGLVIVLILALSAATLVGRVVLCYVLFLLLKQVVADWALVWKIFAYLGLGSFAWIFILFEWAIKRKESK